jgi:hypothetical protein
VVFETVLVLVSLLHDLVLVRFLVDRPVSLGKLFRIVLKALFEAFHIPTELLKLEVEYLLLKVIFFWHGRRDIIVSPRFVAIHAQPVVAFPAVENLSLTVTFLAFIATATSSDVGLKFTAILAARGRDHNFRYLRFTILRFFTETKEFIEVRVFQTLVRHDLSRFSLEFFFYLLLSINNI